MHIYVPHELDEDPAECRGHHVRNRIINMLTPSSRADYCSHRYRFSMFYTAAHVFTFMNTIIYWAVLVPSGHGGFKPPRMPHYHHTPGNATSGAFDSGSYFPFQVLTQDYTDQLADSRKKRQRPLQRWYDQVFQHHQRLVHHVCHCFDRDLSPQQH